MRQPEPAKPLQHLAPIPVWTADELVSQESERQQKSANEAEREQSERITKIDNAVTLAANDLVAALASDVIAVLADIKEDAPALFMKYRGDFKRANPDLLMPDFDRMVSAHIDQKVHDVEASITDDQGPGPVEQIIEHVKAVGELFLSGEGTPYVRSFDTPRTVHALNSKALRQQVARSMYEQSGRAPKGSQWVDAETVLAGMADAEGSSRDVHLRAAPDGEGGYIIDMCDDEWRAVRCTRNGWQVLDQSPVLFRRTGAMKPMPYPSTSGTLEDVTSMFNVSPDDHVLLVTSLIECLRPDTPEPIVEFCGTMGSGKTRSGHNFRNLIDPHEAPLRAPPRVISDVYVSAANNRALAFDNVSSLSSDLQDTTCVISTGGASAARTLYSDADETIINVKRPIILTTITTPFTRPDALSRVLRFECPTFGSSKTTPKRRTDAELSAEFADLHPGAFGFLLDTLCAALKGLDDVKLTEAPRLLDFCRLGEAVSVQLGHLSGCFTNKYLENLRATAVQSLEAEPVFDTLRELVIRKGSIEKIEIGVLRRRLSEFASTANLAQPPGTDRALGALITRYSDALAQSGLTIKPAGRSSAGRRVSIDLGGIPSGDQKKSSKNTCIKCTTYTQSVESARSVDSACSAGGFAEPAERDTHEGVL